MKSSIAVFKPSGYNDCTKIVDLLRDKTPVIMNLETIDDAAAIKMLDFLTGALFALNGGMDAITQDCFFLYPDSIEIKRFSGK